MGINHYDSIKTVWFIVDSKAWWCVVDWPFDFNITTARNNTISLWVNVHTIWFKWNSSSISGRIMNHLHTNLDLMNNSRIDFLNFNKICLTFWKTPISRCVKSTDTIVNDDFFHLWNLLKCAHLFLSQRNIFSQYSITNRANYSSQNDLFSSCGVQWKDRNDRKYLLMKIHDQIKDDEHHWAIGEGFQWKI